MDIYKKSPLLWGFTLAAFAVFLICYFIITRVILFEIGILLNIFLSIVSFPVVLVFIMTVLHINGVIRESNAAITSILTIVIFIIFSFFVLSCMFIVSLLHQDIKNPMMYSRVIAAKGGSYTEHFPKRIPIGAKDVEFRYVAGGFQDSYSSITLSFTTTPERIEKYRKQFEETEKEHISLSENKEEYSFYDGYTYSTRKSYAIIIKSENRVIFNTGHS